MVVVIDSHCHIAGPEFAGDLDAVVSRATEAGVTHALVILAADDPPEIEQAHTVASRWSGARFSIGVHPHAAGKFAADAEAAARAVAAAIDAQPLTRGLGEIGLDYHYDFSPRDVQQEVFRSQIALARERRLPIVIHTREAEDDTFRILDDRQFQEYRGLEDFRRLLLTTARMSRLHLTLFAQGVRKRDPEQVALANQALERANEFRALLQRFVP